MNLWLLGGRLHVNLTLSKNHIKIHIIVHLITNVPMYGAVHVLSEHYYTLKVHSLCPTMLCEKTWTNDGHCPRYFFFLPSCTVVQSFNEQKLLSYIGVQEERPGCILIFFGHFCNIYKQCSWSNTIMLLESSVNFSVYSVFVFSDFCLYSWSPELLLQVLIV